MDLVIYLTVAGLFFLGAYGLMTQRNLIKLIICLNVMEAALLLFLVRLSHRTGGTFPIIQSGVWLYTDPVSQALSLTAIVIGASTTALLLALSVLVYRAYGTLDVRELRRLRG